MRAKKFVYLKRASGSWLKNFPRGKLFLVLGGWRGGREVRQIPPPPRVDEHIPGRDSRAFGVHTLRNKTIEHRHFPSFGKKNSPVGHIFEICPR